MSVLHLLTRRSAIRKPLAPFFRIPGLGRTDAIEDYLASKSLVTWSADVVADDWKRIGAREIVRRAIRRLEARGRGILLLHDIHPATVTALPVLLKELKDRGYHVVQVVADGERPESVPEPVASQDAKEPWPRALQANTTQDTPDKTALRHRGKKAVSGKRRRPAMATLREPNYGATAKDWRQKQF